MIALDVTPLALGPRRGVARAVAHVLLGLAEAPPAEPVVLLSPGPLPEDVAAPGRVVVHPSRSARAFRRALPRLLEREGATVLWSPWSAFPRTDVPVVATVHELPFVRWRRLESPLREWADRRWLRRDVRRAAAIVVPSEATRADVLALHPEAAPKVRVVPWGFDPRPWEAPVPLPRIAGRYLLVVGSGRGVRGARKKGLDVLWRLYGSAEEEVTPMAPEGSIDVTYAAWDAVLVVADDWRKGPASFIPLVRVLPAVGEDELRSLLGGSRLLVYPSRSEGFGYPPLEAMAAGVPVVTTDAGSIPEVVGDAALVVPAGDADALRRAIDEVWEDGPRRAALIERGRVRARAFPVGEAARRLVAVLLAARGAP